MILGIMALFSAFIVLVILGVIAIIKRSLGSIYQYFSPQQRALRKFYWTQTRQIQIKQLFSHQINYINYYYQRKTEKLLQRDNNKQIIELANIIKKQLVAQKKQLNKSEFKHLQQQLKRYQKQKNSHGLLQLQQRLTTLKNDD
jgi:hypothetical protein